MKRIDIHTKKELKDDEIRYSNSISPKVMKIYVFNNIDFFLSDYQWSLIDEAFSDYWNNKIGIGGYFYWDEITDYVFNNIVEKQQLISRERIEFIIEMMLSKIEKDGGFLD